jgi:hypothetical protein
MFAVFLPCLPCLTKHTKQDICGNDRKKRKFDSPPSHTAGSEPFTANDVQGLAGIRTRMQEMGHFLNDSSTDPTASTLPEINLDTKKMAVTAELISVAREPRNYDGKPGTASSILDRRPSTIRIPDRNFVTCKADEEPSICLEWDQLKKNIECKAVRICIVVSFFDL